MVLGGEALETAQAQKNRQAFGLAAFRWLRE
jgi:hypothetical protein